MGNCLSGGDLDEAQENKYLQPGGVKPGQKAQAPVYTPVKGEKASVGLSGNGLQASDQISQGPSTTVGSSQASNFVSGRPLDTAMKARTTSTGTSAMRQPDAARDEAESARQGGDLASLLAELDQARASEAKAKQQERDAQEFARVTAELRAAKQVQADAEQRAARARAQAQMVTPSSAPRPLTPCQATPNVARARVDVTPTSEPSGSMSRPVRHQASPVTRRLDFNSASASPSKDQAYWQARLFKCIDEAARDGVQLVKKGDHWQLQCQAIQKSPRKQCECAAKAQKLEKGILECNRHQGWVTPASKGSQDKRAHWQACLLECVDDAAKIGLQMLVTQSPDTSKLRCLAIQRNEQQCSAAASVQNLAKLVQACGRRPHDTEVPPASIA